MSTHKRYKPQNTPQKPQAANVELVMIPTAPRRDGFSAGQWRKAMKLAESVEYPSRTLLYDLYNDILLDTHLESVIGKRRDNIEGTKFTFNTGTSTRSEKIDKLIGMPWFTTMCADLLDARFFGHTLSWVDLSGGVFHKYEMLRRKHVIPEKHVHLLRQSDRTGIDYTLPPYSNYIIEAGERDDFGLLLKVAIWVLFKRGDISDWATFNEMFSMPFRLGKYPQYDNEAKKALGEACRDSASKSWAIIPNTTELSFIKNEVSGNTAAYREFGEFCDKQMSKATVRNTMTTDAEGGQYKGEVHQESEKGVFASDRRFVLNILNTSFRTLLELHGFTPGDGKFVCVEEDHICLKDRITIDMQASQKVVIPPVYWYDKYGYPIPEGGPQAVASSPPTELSEMRNELQGMRAQLCEVQKREQERADNAPLPITPPVRRKGFFG